MSPPIAYGRPLWGPPLSGSTAFGSCLLCLIDGHGDLNYVSYILRNTRHAAWWSMNKAGLHFIIIRKYLRLKWNRRLAPRVLLVVMLLLFWWLLRMTLYKLLTTRFKLRRIKILLCRRNLLCWFRATVTWVVRPRIKKFPPLTLKLVRVSLKCRRRRSRLLFRWVTLCQRATIPWCRCRTVLKRHWLKLRIRRLGRNSMVSGRRRDARCPGLEERSVSNNVPVSRSIGLR